MSEETAEPPPPTATEEPPMEFHKPKPVHNWREFMTELAVVVLGVCIALAAEQGVEWLHWRNEVDAARQAIASEMAGNLTSAVARLDTQACVESRLDELGQILDSASRSGSLPPVGDIGIAARSVWSNGAWQGILASQTATHFDRTELVALANVYFDVDRLVDNFLLENQAWADLDGMVGPGRRLDPASDAELRKALGLARNSSRSMAQLSIDLVNRLNARYLPYSREDLNRIAAAKAAVADAIPGNAKSTRAVCRPIGVVPPQYGYSGLPVSPKNIAKSLALLPGAATPPAP